MWCHEIWAKRVQAKKLIGWVGPILKSILNQQRKVNVCYLVKQRTGYLALLPEIPTGLTLFSGCNLTHKQNLTLCQSVFLLTVHWIHHQGLHIQSPLAHHPSLQWHQQGQQCGKESWSLSFEYCCYHCTYHCQWGVCRVAHHPPSSSYKPLIVCIYWLLNPEEILHSTYTLYIHDSCNKHAI